MKLETTAEQLGKAIGEAAATTLLGRIGLAVLLCMLTLWVANYIYRRSGAGMDDSDRDAKTRSGLRLHTDYKTGVQYFSAPGGGLTPRLDRDGRPIVVDVGAKP